MRTQQGESMKNFIINTFYVISILISTIWAGRIKYFPEDAPWHTNKFTPSNGNYKIVNFTNRVQQIDGIRFSLPVAPTSISSFDNSFESASLINDGNGVNRYEIKIGNITKSGRPLNILTSGGSHTISLALTSAADSGTNWTPFSPQILAKVGSFAEEKTWNEVTGITLGTLDSLSQTSDFYNSSLYLEDTLGIHGGPYGSGFIDTWYNQDEDKPLWQIQVAIPSDTFKVWNEIKRFEPYRMDDRDSANYGVGPLFMMSVAMVQEYLNIDMQYLLATSFQESNAGLVSYSYYQEYDPILNSTIIKEIDHGVNYTNHKTNGAQTIGPMHLIETAYESYIFNGFPEFFPYDQTYEPSSKYLTTPSTGGCELNSPQIGNAYLLSGIYLWYSWYLVKMKLREEALEFYKNASNKKIGAQMISWAWNKGFNGSFATYTNNPDPNKDIVSDIDYVDHVWDGVEHLENGSRNSIANGGTDSIYDANITLLDLERLFFGEGGNPANGVLGTAGILHHFKHSNSERIQIWNEIISAFSLLKGRAPSTIGKEAISYRYDYLAILRIIKKYLDLSIPVPKTSEFLTWIEFNSNPDPSFISMDNVYPYFNIGAVTTTNDTVFIDANVADNRYLDITGRVVEWCLDTNWESWYTASFVSGDTLTSDYKLVIPRNVAEGFVANVETPFTVWLRGVDKNYNAVIDTTLIAFDAVSNLKNCVSMHKEFKVIKHYNSLQVNLKDKLKASSRISVFNIQGKEIVNTQIEEGTSSFWIKNINLSSGIYFVSIVNNSTHNNYKFQILR